MTTVLRESTLQTLGLGNVIEIFQRGQLPVETSGLVDIRQLRESECHGNIRS